MAPSDTFTFEEIGLDRLEMIRPLWVKLNAHHIDLAPDFAQRRSRRSFDDRLREWREIAAGGCLKIDLVTRTSDQTRVAYCVTTLSAKLDGEIDSLFVEAEIRGQGVGSELMRRALAWLTERGAKSKLIVVAHGNDAAMRFYARFGFKPNTVHLREPD
ncbi:MAG TPA: GNAT family N-acetyltransferase [Planctomycetota bacterium]|nr:GNAT family N-acetyltransferase [Planctomycetota bacterium]